MEKRKKAWETAKAFLDSRRGSDGLISTGWLPIPLPSLLPFLPDFPLFPYQREFHPQTQVPQLSLSGEGDITVWINSPGGDVFAAAQIYNMLMDYKGNVTVKIDGISSANPSSTAFFALNQDSASIRCEIFVRFNPVLIS